MFLAVLLSCIINLSKRTLISRVLIISITATVNYVRVGCFKDKPVLRAMTLLASYRKDKSIDWNDLKTSVVDKCAFEVPLTAAVV